MDAPSPASQVKRHPERGAYDAETVHAILDAAFVGHLGFTVDEQPFVIPVLYGRDGDRLVVHGSVASRAMRTAATGIRCCFTVTILDGLVLARSTFHHSLNYRSVVVLGTATEIRDEAEKTEALDRMVDHMLAGRSAEARSPNRIELRQTAVLAIPLTEASAKVRTGGPVDDEADLTLDVWAGVVPTTTTWGTPIPDPALAAGIELAPSLSARLESELRP